MYKRQDYGYSTDWYDLLLRDFSYDNNQYLSIDGSTKNGYYGASFNYKKATGLDLNSSREEFGGRFVLNQRMMDGIIELNGSLNARRVNEVWGNDGMFDTALSMNPVSYTHLDVYKRQAMERNSISGWKPGRSLNFML